jgi:transcriptional regulator with XRE-family HTH domain
MSDAKSVIIAIKRILDANGISYKKLAEDLKLSESSVKRIFSKGTFTLDRLDQICKIAKTNLTEVVSLAESLKGEESYVYNISQEEYLAKNPECLGFFDLIIQGKPVIQIVNKLNLTKAGAGNHLTKLESLGLIHRMPHDRIKLLVSRNIRWQKNGPLRRAFLSKVKEEFLQSSFDGSLEKFTFLSLSLSEANRTHLLIQIQKLAQEFETISRFEQQARIDTKNIGLIFAVREWDFIRALTK